MAAVKVTAPRVAVMTAASEVAMVAAEAVKAAEGAPAGTVKIAGTVNRVGRLLERETGTPPGGAALEREIVHAVLALQARLTAAALRPERVLGANNGKVDNAEEPVYG